MVSKTKELCPRCAQGKLVTDNESGEMFCSKCGFVMTEKLQEANLEKCSALNVDL
jgi:transcription initiation factor TFIIB